MIKDIITQIDEQIERECYERELFIYRNLLFGIAAIYPTCDKAFRDKMRLLFDQERIKINERYPSIVDRLKGCAITAEKELQ